MSKRVITLALAALFVLGSLALAQAWGGGNWRKGKYLFRKYCRTCHVSGGSAQDLSPINHKQAEWKAIFEGQKFPCRAKWPQMSQKDLNDIYTHLYEHAADSPTPARCK